MPLRSPTITDELADGVHQRRRSPARRTGGDRDPEPGQDLPDPRAPDGLLQGARRPIPLTRMEYRELHALRDISFDIHQGEFFGIVGRNGSGKSSLLKILASIYRADGGRVRMAGRLAPFIELGVGFNPELTARENGVLNGVLMGLTRREARRRLGRGDRVRRAGGLRRPQAQELLLGDDGAVRVLGDGPGRRRHHADRRGPGRRRRGIRPEVHGRLSRAKSDAGKTIVLVTHDMATVQSMCHRAVLLDERRDQVHRRSGRDRTALLPPEFRRPETEPRRGRASARR